MLRKKSFYIISLIFGITLVGISFFFRGEDLKAIAGVCIGIGAGLFGMSIANIVMKHLEHKNPQIAKQNEIELKDERNIMIRNRAKAKAADISQWFIMGIAYVTIIINAPLWVTFATVCVFALYNILSIYLSAKYQREM